MLYLVMLTSLVLALMAADATSSTASTTKTKIQHKDQLGLSAQHNKNVPSQKISESE